MGKNHDIIMGLAHTVGYLSAKSCLMIEVWQSTGMLWLPRASRATKKLKCPDSFAAVHGCPGNPQRSLFAYPNVNSPAGKPHFDIKSTIMDVARGVFSLGLITHVHPVARMGPSLYPRLSNGKFHVRTQTTTPTGEYLV